MADKETKELIIKNTNFFIFVIPLILIIIPFIPISIDGTPSIVFKYIKSIFFALTIYLLFIYSKINSFSFLFAILIFLLGLANTILSLIFLKIQIQLEVMMLFVFIFILFCCDLDETISKFSIYCLKVFSLINILLSFYFIQRPDLQINFYTWNEGQVEFFSSVGIPVSIYGLYTISSSLFLFLCLFWIHIFFETKKITSLIYISIFIYLIAQPLIIFSSLQALLSLTIILFFIIIYTNKYLFNNHVAIRSIVYIISTIIFVYIAINNYEWLLNNDGFQDRFFNEYLANSLNFIFMGIGFNSSYQTIFGMDLSLGDFNHGDIMIRFSLLGFFIYYILLFNFIRLNVGSNKFLIFPIFISLFLLDAGHSLSRSIYFLPILILYLLSIKHDLNFKSNKK